MAEIVKSLKYGDMPNGGVSLDAFKSKNVYVNVHHVREIVQRTARLPCGIKVKSFILIQVDGSEVDISVYFEK